MINGDCANGSSDRWVLSFMTYKLQPGTRRREASAPVCTCFGSLRRRLMTFNSNCLLISKATEPNGCPVLTMAPMTLFLADCEDTLIAHGLPIMRIRLIGKVHPTTTVILPPWSSSVGLLCVPRTPPMAQKIWRQSEIQSLPLSYHYDNVTTRS
jgi:hypothetical protein